MVSFIYFILFGAAAGWIASTLFKGRGMGLLGNIIVGILGAVVGGWAFGALGISMGGGLIGSLITAVVGAIILLFVVGLVRKNT